MTVQKQKEILVIDDDKSILRTYKKALSNHGYFVDTAETAEEALDKAQKKHFDLVLVDIRLPGMSGTELLSKAEALFKGTAKVMVTGFPSLETGVQSLDKGADAYLVKPVQIKELIEVIDTKIAEAATT